MHQRHSGKQYGNHGRNLGQFYSLFLGEISFVVASNPVSQRPPGAPHTIPAFSRGSFFIRSPRDMLGPCLVSSPGSPAGMPNSRQIYWHPHSQRPRSPDLQSIGSAPKGIYRKQLRKMPLGCANCFNKEHCIGAPSTEINMSRPLQKNAQGNAPC